MESDHLDVIDTSSLAHCESKLDTEVFAVDTFRAASYSRYVPIAWYMHFVEEKYFR
jgi:hypothetical protein